MKHDIPQKKAAKLLATLYHHAAESAVTLGEFGQKGQEMPPQRITLQEAHRILNKHIRTQKSLENAAENAEAAVKKVEEKISLITGKATSNKSSETSSAHTAKAASLSSDKDEGEDDSAIVRKAATRSCVEEQIGHIKRTELIPAQEIATRAQQALNTQGFDFTISTINDVKIGVTFRRQKGSSEITQVADAGWAKHYVAQDCTSIAVTLDAVVKSILRETLADRFSNEEPVNPSSYLAQLQRKLTTIKGVPTKGECAAIQALQAALEAGSYSASSTLLLHK